MYSYIWPVALVVLANTLYQISAKSIPERLDPLASVTVVYLVGAVSSAILYYALNSSPNILNEYSKLNWTPFALGISVVGLEVGMIYAYKAGWPASTLTVTQSTLVAIVMIFVGSFMFSETITWNKIVGIVVCIAGLALINWK